MATIGLKDLYVAKITSADDVAVPTYATPVRLAKAIKVDLSVETAEAALYADDSIDAVEREFVGGEIKLNVNDLSNENLALLLGWETDSDGVLYGSANATAPYFAIGFRAKKPGGKYKYLWIYKAKFAAPAENYETKGNSINFVTPEISAKFMARADGRWKADYTALETDQHAQAWFTKVREKAD